MLKGVVLMKWAVERLLMNLMTLTFLFESLLSAGNPLLMYDL